jgi:paired amphipathic helix protein Sin3a
VEALYNNEIEQHAFEDQMRAVFGIQVSCRPESSSQEFRSNTKHPQHAYKVFTTDKICGAIIKQLQIIQLDHKSKELLEILKKERSLVSPTTQDQKNNRQNTERVLGPDENIFRIDWVRPPALHLILKDVR